MSCGCGGGRRSAAAPLIPQDQLLAPTEWGPILWRYLHCIAEKIGTSGNKIIDTDQANYTETLIIMLPQILPCTECQVHAATYLAANPLPSLKGMYGAELQMTVRVWLYHFHNAVRASKQQPIDIISVEECQATYINYAIPKCSYTLFVQSVAAAVRQGWVRIEHWRKWYSNSEKIRIITGNIII
jgi:Erv1 / Alr family